MQPLRFSINVSLDGCCDHQAITPDEETHQYAAEGIAQADGLPEAGEPEGVPLGRVGDALRAEIGAKSAERSRDDPARVE